MDLCPVLETERRTGRLPNTNLQGAQNVGRKVTDDLAQGSGRVRGRGGNPDSARVRKGFRETLGERRENHICKSMWHRTNRK